MRTFPLNQNIIFKAIFIFLLLFVSLHAKETLVSHLKNDTSLIKVSTLKSKESTIKIVKKFNALGYDTLVLQHTSYEIYVANVSSDNFQNTLKNIQTYFPSAYKSQKKSFTTNGIFLLETSSQMPNTDFVKNDSFLETSIDNNLSIPQNSDMNISQEYNATVDTNLSLAPVQKPLVLEKEKERPSTNKKLETYFLGVAENNLKNTSPTKKNINSKEKHLDDEGKVKIDLIDAVLQALSISHKLQANREKLIQAKYNIDIAYGDYLPSVDVSYTLAKTEERPGDFNMYQEYDKAKRYTDEQYTLSLSQNIYAGGETSNEIERLKAQYLVAKTDFERLLEDEISKAVTAYIDVVFTRESMQISKKNMEELETIFQIVKAKFDAGALSIGELNSIEASVSNAKSQLSKTSSKYNNALEYFKYITGELYQDKYPYEKIIHVEVPSIEKLIDQIEQKNSLIKNYDYNILSKKFHLKKLKAPFRPQVDLTLAAEKITDQEDYEYDEDSYTATLSVSYNLYNGNKDNNMYLKTFSSMQEVIFEKEGEIRKIKWELEKLHTSLTSSQENLSNVENEVDSSRGMVSSYWESFRNGEQDLHVLLQGQRQLNTAELSLLSNEQDSMKDYFDILKISGDLMSYFKIDTNEENYLDMAKAKYRAQYKAPKESSSDTLESPIKAEDINETKTIDDSIVKNIDTNVSTLADLLSFHEKFLIENPEKYTIIFNDFSNPIEGLKKISELNISKSSFIYEYFEDQKIKTKIAYGIFDSFNDANKTLLESPLSDTDVNKKDVVTIGKVQEELKEFSTLFFINAENIPKVVTPPKVEKPKEKPYENDIAFKDKFLNAPENYFTINITTFASWDLAGKIVKQQNIQDASFVFNFGENEKWYKLMYGVFETYEEAQQALKSLGNINTIYMPIIEKIAQKQELYYRFNK
jgi:outer membrane protein TolC